MAFASKGVSPCTEVNCDCVTDSFYVVTYCAQPKELLLDGCDIYVVYAFATD